MGATLDSNVNNKVKLFVATPMYGGMCHGDYAQGLIRLNDICTNLGWEMKTAFVYNESLINRARNDLVKAFLATDCTHLLFIDADIGIDPFHIPSLVNEDKDIIGGMYPLKMINWDKLKIAIKNNDPEFYYKAFNYVFDNNGKNINDLGTVEEVKYIGTGYMLIKRDVFYKIPATSYINNSLMYKEDQNKYTQNFFGIEIDNETNFLLSEDYFFCKSWRDIGGKIYIATYAKAHHIGSMRFG